MTFIETYDHSYLEVADEIATGAQLSIARDGLRQFLALPSQTPEGYTNHLVDYFNSFQRQHFEGHPADVQIAQNRSLNATALVVKQEVECILGDSIETVEDIQLRLKGNLNDEFAEIIEDAGCHPLPRAVTMTLFELIEDYR